MLFQPVFAQWETKQSRGEGTMHDSLLLLTLQKAVIRKSKLKEVCFSVEEFKIVFPLSSSTLTLSVGFSKLKNSRNISVLSVDD
jgi:hypothetical protein